MVQSTNFRSKRFAKRLGTEPTINYVKDYVSDRNDQEYIQASGSKSPVSQKTN